jgi:phospholipid-binding lipoprotein MlaA
VNLATTRRLGLAALAASTLMLGGCTTLRQARGGPGQQLDPWESWNRKVFAFNEGLDEKVLKPVATGYSNIVPQPVRRGVSNFFGNFADAWSAINNFLQGKPALGMQDIMRVGTNTVFGMLGIVDFATEFGMERHNEDFGQTLGVWGFGAGAYIVWPLFGPSTVRDSIALPLDVSVSPAWVVRDGTAKFGLTTLQLVNTRANLLGASRVLDDIAIDKYNFIRDAYLQRRRSLVYDGDEPPPPEPDDAEPAASPASEAASAPAGK